MTLASSCRIRAGQGKTCRIGFHRASFKRNGHDYRQTTAGSTHRPPSKPSSLAPLAIEIPRDYSRLPPMNIARRKVIAHSPQGDRRIPGYPRRAAPAISTGKRAASGKPPILSRGFRSKRKRGATYATLCKGIVDSNAASVRFEGYVSRKKRIYNSELGITYMLRNIARA